LTRVHFDFGAFRRLIHFATKRCAEEHLARVAGSLTFTTVLSLVPLLTVAFALFTAFPIFSSFQAALQGFLAGHLMPAQFNSQIFKYLDQFSSKARGLTTAGLGVLVVTSVMTMMTVESAFNVIWRVRKARPLAQRVLVYWAVLTLGPILFGMSLSISSFLFSESLVLSGDRQMPKLIFGLLSSSTVPITALAFTMLYAYLPNCRVEWRDALAGGIVAAIAFEFAKRGFGLYVRRVPTYAAVYGAFAAFPIFLLWVYLSWLITLIGAMIGSTLPLIREGHFQRPSFSGSALLDALEVLARLSLARERGEGGVSELDLARGLRADSDNVAGLLDRLENRELIARLYDGGLARRFVLLANPAVLSLKSLFDFLVVDREEMLYQLGLSATNLDAAALMEALGGAALDRPVSTLIKSSTLQPARLPGMAGAGEAAPALAAPNAAKG
jgi:membrane protein